MKIFNNNLKNNSKTIALTQKQGDIGKIKYLPSFSKEWKNIIYCYNQNNLKNIPVNNVNINKIIQSYFNLYFKNPKFVEGGGASEPTERRVARSNKSRLHNKKLILRAAKLPASRQKLDFFTASYKKRRNFLRRIYVSNAEIKHTNNKAIITLYTVNRESKILKAKYLKINKKVSKNIIKRFLFLYKKNAACGGSQSSRLYKIFQNFSRLMRVEYTFSADKLIHRKNFLNYKLKYFNKFQNIYLKKI